jgi:hypothetical protein
MKEGDSLGAWDKLPGHRWCITLALCEKDEKASPPHIATAEIPPYRDLATALLQEKRPLLPEWEMEDAGALRTLEDVKKLGVSGGRKQRGIAESTLHGHLVKVLDERVSSASGGA